MTYVPFIRRVVGSRKIVLVYATVILWDSQHRILVQARTDLPFWGLPGGVLEWGESLEQCARRELREESGLEAGELRLVGLYSSPAYDVEYPNGDRAQQFTVCFAGPVAGGSMQVDTAEASDQRFVAVDALPGMPLLPWYADMIADWQRDAPPRLDPFSEDCDSVAEETEHWPPPSNLPAIVATVGLLVAGRGDAVAVRSSPLLIGESATDAAYRLAAVLPGTTVVPERLLGVASGLCPDRPRLEPRRQHVVAWFLARSHLSGNNMVQGDADDLPGLQLALRHRNGGYFVE